MYDYLDQFKMKSLGVVFARIICREVHDWELDSVTSFFTHIYSQVPNGEGGDRMRWSLNGSGTFDVCPFYKAIRGTGGIPFPWKSIWRIKSPKRVSFLCALPLGVVCVSAVVK